MNKTSPQSLSKLLSLLYCLFLICNFPSGESITVEELPEAINNIINSTDLARMEWGIQIVSQNSSNTAQYVELYSLNPTQFFTPASNNKVLSTAAAFLYLGEDFRVETPIYADSNYTQNMNSVCIAGKGDPTFTSFQLFEIINEFLKNGVESINEVILDDTYFLPPFPQAWEWEDLQADYGAQPTSFILTQNNIEFSISPSNIAGEKPLINFSHQFDYQCVEVANYAKTIESSATPKYPLSVGYKLGSNIIQVIGEIQTTASSQSFVLNSLKPVERFQCALSNLFDLYRIKTSSMIIGSCSDSSSSPSSYMNLFNISSPRLVETMNYTLQVSNNLYAECFQRCLGNHMSGLEGNNAHEKGIEAVQSVLQSYGVDGTSFDQDDGSGLSRHNLVSPQSLIQAFVAMANSEDGDVYRRLLPVAGESGSLANRFVNTTAQGIVQAKTGSMSGVNSLSGYIDATSNFPEIIFSILTNFSNHPGSTVREAIDSIVVLLTQLTN